MKKIKETLIHWLGGFTLEDDRRHCQAFYILGLRHRASSFKKQADRLYGLPAEEWCKQMYEFISDRVPEDDERQNI